MTNSGDFFSVANSIFFGNVGIIREAWQTSGIPGGQGAAIMNHGTRTTDPILALLRPFSFCEVTMLQKTAAANTARGMPVISNIL